MAGTGVWQRNWITTNFATGDTAYIGEPQNVYLGGASTTALDVCVRQMLDYTLSINAVTTPGGAAPNDFWTNLAFLIAVGVGAVGHVAPLNLNDAEDAPRIQGTGLLVPGVGYPSVLEGSSVCTWHLERPIDSHGMRKTPVAGLQLLPMVTIQAVESAPTLNEDFQWFLTSGGYFRTLFDTPS